MNEFKEFLTSSEMIIVGIIAAIGCFLGLLVFIFEKTYYIRKRKHNTKVLNNLVEGVSEDMENLEDAKKINVFTAENNVIAQPSVSTIEEVVPLEKEVTMSIDNEKTNEENNVEVLESLPEVSEDYEKPLVIPIEEYEERNRIEQIYSEVKKQVELLENNPIEEDLEYTDIEPNKEEAIAELKKVTEELINKEEQKEENNNNIELTKFEEEQEENAIISMDELLKKSNELYEQNEVTQYEDEGNEPISLQDLELRMKNIKSEMMEIEKEEDVINNEDMEIVEPISEVETNNKKVVLDDFNTIDNSDKIYRDDIVFKSSPIISPIFGIEDNNPSNDMVLENTANYDKFDEEIKKTNEFIVTLKELQEKLD